MLLKKIFSDPRNLERILDNLQDGIIAHDMNRRIFYYNRKSEEITGYSRDEVLGKDCHEAHGGPFCGEHCLFCSSSAPLPHMPHSPQKKIDADRVEYSITITTKSGESRQLDVVATMMKDENGQDFGVLASFRDITDIMDLQIRMGEITNFSNIIGQSPMMLQVFQQIRDIAMYDSPVHIYGETGTGKELVALAIHNQSDRRAAPFVAINCGALPDGLVESELFGHIKGAFSGAVRDKKGRFELADKGTIFLDEIAELPKHIQVKLLRFLQEGTLEKVGSEKIISINARIISASNKNLKKEVEKNNFRSDLYYRLNVIPVDLPPLRERKSDIPLLCNHFLKQAAEKYKKKRLKVSKEAMSAMMDYKWPGNVRELENIIQFAMIKCKGNEISFENLPMELTDMQAALKKRGPLEKLDSHMVKEALEKTGGNKASAARLLGVGRATLYRFLNKQV